VDKQEDLNGLNKFENKVNYENARKSLELNTNIGTSKLVIN